MQLGKPSPGSGKTDSLAMLWHASFDDKAVWSVEVRPALSVASGKPAEKPTRKTVAVKDVPPFEILSANLSGLKPGALFDYRVVKSGRPYFPRALVLVEARKKPQRVGDRRRSRQRGTPNREKSPSKSLRRSPT